MKARREQQFSFLISFYFSLIKIEKSLNYFVFQDFNFRNTFFLFHKGNALFLKKSLFLSFGYSKIEKSPFFYSCSLCTTSNTVSVPVMYSSFCVSPKSVFSYFYFKQEIIIIVKLP